MELKPLKSSNVEAVGYDHATKEMHVRFKGKDTVYKHEGVESSDHLSFVHDRSPGAHYAKYIRGKFKVSAIRI